MILHVTPQSLIAVSKRRMRVGKGSERSVWGKRLKGGIEKLISIL